MMGQLLDRDQNARSLGVVGVHFPIRTCELIPIAYGRNVKPCMHTAKSVFKICHMIKMLVGHARLILSGMIWSQLK
jgi:hypothetical protein